jgi:hypothetical protein
MFTFGGFAAQREGFVKGARVMMNGVRTAFSGKEGGMGTRAAIVEFVVGLLLWLPAGISRPVDFPSAVPESLGLNIHFVAPKLGEMEMLAASGAHWARMDFVWEATEKAPGQYDFGAYDGLVKALESHHVRPYFILDYANPLYDNGMSPYTEEGRQAFGRWAAAAVEHFAGRGIMWEIYNEPNFRFWRPQPNTHDYVLLALEVGEAIRGAAPGEAYVGPACSLIDLKFLEACFRAGLLNYWSAISVHPYRQRDPESAAEEYDALRRLMASYGAKGEETPIIAGEWGYSSTWNWKGMDETKQAKMLVREFLANLANGVPLTIWYDWHDDSADGRDPESHFGTVYFPYAGGSKPVYRPKPAYLALQTLSRMLGGFRYSRRLEVGGKQDYVLLFTRGEEVRLAAWTISSSQRTVEISAGRGRVAETNYLGHRLAPVKSRKWRLEITLGDAPVYLVPGHWDKSLQEAAGVK